MSAPVDVAALLLLMDDRRPRRPGLIAASLDAVWDSHTAQAQHGDDAPLQALDTTRDCSDLELESARLRGQGGRLCRSSHKHKARGA